MTIERERRKTRRHERPEEHGIVRARVRPGHDVELIDVSAGGALLESRHRLLPGMRVDLHLADGTRCTSVRGCILRCAVARLVAGQICYRGAICFERELPWFIDASAGYS